MPWPGLRPGLLNDIEKLPGARILDGQFSAVQQAVGTARTKARQRRFPAQLVEEAKSSGLVARLIEKHKVVGRLWSRRLGDHSRSVIRGARHWTGGGTLTLGLQLIRRTSRRLDTDWTLPAAALRPPWRHVPRSRPPADIADQVHRLADDQRRGVEVAGRTRRVVAYRLLGLLLQRVQPRDRASARKSCSAPRGRNTGRARHCGAQCRTGHCGQSYRRSPRRCGSFAPASAAASCEA